MPNETNQAIDWAMTQLYFGVPVSKEDPQSVVDKVREYFNTNAITYSTFSYEDFETFFN